MFASAGTISVTFYDCSGNGSRINTAVANNTTDRWNWWGASQSILHVHALPEALFASRRFAQRFFEPGYWTGASSSFTRTSQRADLGAAANSDPQQTQISGRTSDCGTPDLYLTGFATLATDSLEPSFAT